MDAIEILEQDHQKIRDLFERFEKQKGKNSRSRASLVQKMIREISVHAHVEEEGFYPPVREAVDEVRDDILESYEEHHVAEWVLSELQNLSPDDESFDAKTTVLTELVSHHLDEEEQELFPKVREELGAERLDDIGTQLRKLRRSVSAEPQPTPAKVTARKAQGRKVAGAAASGGTTKKASTKKASARKATAKKSTAKKASAKKAPAKRSSTAKKSPARRTTKRSTKRR